MSQSVQSFLAAVTPEAADGLAAAFERLPEDRREWSPGGQARSALNLVAECALLNGYTADLLQTRRWPAPDLQDYLRELGVLTTQGWEPVRALLQENTRKFSVAVAAVPDDALDADIVMPWGTQTMTEVAAYPYWNMKYHEGQINYLIAILSLD